MRNWLDAYGKDLLCTLIELCGDVETEHEVIRQVQRCDVWFVPDPQRMRSHGQELGVIERMLAQGPCSFELFSRTPNRERGLACLRRHMALHQEQTLSADRDHARAAQRGAGRQRMTPEIPASWLLSPGRPEQLIHTLALEPMDGWPPGFLQMPGELKMHVVVIRELPRTPETLFLRLLCGGPMLTEAMAELAALPANSPAHDRSVQVLVAWRDKIFNNSKEAPMRPETKAIYDKWEQEVLARGRQEGVAAGRREGMAAGRQEGRRALVRKQLMLRFGELPAEVTERLRRASAAELERWAERVLTARRLSDVLDD